MASDALKVTGVDAYYGDSHVLHGVSFTLQSGRLLALLGRNGAGKTTCMNSVIGFLKPRNGLISGSEASSEQAVPLNEVISTRNAS